MSSYPIYLAPSLIEKKIYSILGSRLNTAIADFNTSQLVDSIDIPTNITIIVGPPIDIWDQTDNTLLNSPTVICSQDRSFFRNTGMEGKVDEESIWRLVVAIPSSSAGIYGSWSQARLLARLAFSLLETHLVDTPDSFDSIIWQVDILDQQPMILVEGHAVRSIVSFKVNSRYSYDFKPWEPQNKTTLAPPFSPIYRQDTIQGRLNTESFVSITTNTTTSYTSSAATISSFELQGPTGANVYAVSEELKGQSLAVTTSGSNPVISLSNLNSIWTTLNSGQFLTIYITGWNSSNSNMYTFTLKLIKGA